MKYYYVTQRNLKTNILTLLGFNLTEVQKDDLFYSLGDGNSMTQEYSNSYGSHDTHFKSKEVAYERLITKPDEFNAALELMNKYGFDVVQKGVVSKKVKVISYQMEFDL